MTLPEVRPQLAGAESDFERVLDHKPEIFALPFSTYSEDKVAEVRMRGDSGGFRLRQPGRPLAGSAFMARRQIVPGNW